MGGQGLRLKAKGRGSPTRWEVGGEEVGGRRWEVGVRREGFGSVCCGPRCCGSVRYGSAGFDTILGESIVETAMRIS